MILLGEEEAVLRNFPRSGAYSMMKSVNAWSNHRPPCHYHFVARPNTRRRVRAATISVPSSDERQASAWPMNTTGCSRRRASGVAKLGPASEATRRPWVGDRPAYPVPSLKYGVCRVEGLSKRRLVKRCHHRLHEKMAASIRQEERAAPLGVVARFGDAVCCRTCGSGVSGECYVGCDAANRPPWSPRCGLLTASGCGRARLWLRWRHDGISGLAWLGTISA